MQGEPPIADPDSRALDDLRGRIVAIDAQMSQLVAQRHALVEQYERHRYAIIGRLHPAATPGYPMVSPAQRQEWSGARVRALLLWLGAALLGISALTFTAVAWSHLGDGGRALLLLAATAVCTALAIAARRRLPMTAEAFVGLAVVLTLVDAYAVRRAGVASGLSWQVWWALGTATSAGYAAALGTLTGRRTARFAVAALLPIAAGLLVTGPDWATSMLDAALATAFVYGMTRWGGFFYPEGRVVLGLYAVGSWMAAAALAGYAAAQPETVPAAVPPALAVGLLAAAPELAARRLTASRLATSLAVLAQGVPAGVALTLVAPLVGTQGALAVAVAAGGATIVASLFLRGTRRTGALVAGTAFAIPGTLFVAGVSLPAVVSPLAWLEEPWTGTVGLVARTVLEGPRITTSFAGSWAAVWALGAIAAVGVALGLRRRVMLGIVTAAVGLAAALVPLNAGSSVLITLVVTTAAFVLVLLASAFADRRQAGDGWALLPGALIAAVPTIGWAAVSTAASVVATAVAGVAAVAAALIAHPAQARPAYAGLGALLGVTFVGIATRAAGAQLPAAGFAVAVAAAALVLAGVFVLRAQPATGVVFEYLGAATTLVGAVVSAGSTPWLAGALTALAAAAALAALGRDRRVIYSCASGALALGAVWAWLAAARIGVVEAYTAPAAAVTLLAGIVLWRSSPGRSWLTLGAALVLAIGPTLLLGIRDNDAVRLIVAALLSFAAVVVGAVLRLQAPLCLGAVALLAIGIDQWGADIIRMPRWITLGAVGVLLMWIGATFEHRRRDWRRASDVFGHFG
ncbi:MAG: hypothetical protein WCP30_10415 [Mycobacteriaceae bacterium]